MTRTINAVWMEKYKRWQINVQADGVRKSFVSTIPGRAGKAEANRKADEWLDSQVMDGSAPVSAVWANWSATLTSKDSIKKASICWRLHFSPVCGKKQMSKITEGDLQAVIDRAAAKGMAWKSLSNIRGTMSAFIKWARKNRYTTLTLEDVDIPKSAVKGKKIILQPDDIVKMWEAPSTLYSNLFKLAVLTGLRPSELVGLKWIDIDENLLHIRRAIDYDGDMSKGKNENAERTLWIGEYEIAVLDAQRDALKKRGVIAPWVFANPDGNFPMQRAVARGWKRFAKSAQLTPGVTPYGWRHTFVSINNEMPGGLKQRRVGHAKNMDTEGVYGHMVIGEQQQAAEYVRQQIDSILRRSQKHTQKHT
jgi:integrase